MHERMESEGVICAADFQFVSNARIFIGNTRRVRLDFTASDVHLRVTLRDARERDKDIHRSAKRLNQDARLYSITVAIITTRQSS